MGDDGYICYVVLLLSMLAVIRDVSRAIMVKMGCRLGDLLYIGMKEPTMAVINKRESYCLIHSGLEYEMVMMLYYIF